MSIFLSNPNDHFDQAKWEKQIKVMDQPSVADHRLERSGTITPDGDQFILLQLSDGDQRVINTSSVVPKLQGAAG